MKIKNATISEAGNGFPGCGEYVYDSDEGHIYRITTPDCDIRIQTGDPGSGAPNFIEVEVEYVGDASAITEEEFDAMTPCGMRETTISEEEFDEYRIAMNPNAAYDDEEGA